MAGTATTKSIHQIVTSDGQAYAATGTENVWVGGAFGLPTGNNEVAPFTTGKDYFAEFVKEVGGAHDEIYITGWQVSWDALVAPGKRLFDVLLAAAQRGVKIYVMPWDDSPPIQTYDDQTKIVFEMINTITGSQCVQVQLATAHADENANFYSHHQKHVVIDRKTAFVGGIDLSYGRYDDAHFNLHADAEGRYALNRYNGCIEWVGEVDATKMVNTDDLKGFWDSYGRNPLSKNSKTNADITLEKIKAGAWQTPYEVQGGGSTAGSEVSPRTEINTATRNTLNPATQPRLPWQDVHCKIVGPAVDDLTRNFVMRWNSTKPKTKLPLPQAKTYPIEGKCLVQVLRSAPLAMCNLEYKMLGASDKKASAMPVEAQDDIQKAMVTLIGKAQHFIYIENQFFVSAFGQLAGYEYAGRDRDPTTGPAKQIMDAGGEGGRWGIRIMPGDERQLPHNGIVDALATRLDAFIRQRKPFHVYITLPVHSEGLLNGGAVVGQVHWTMQSLVFGTQSLLNRIRRSFRARALYEKDPHADWRQAYADHDQGYLEIPLEKCFDYVTVLNLRNWAKLGSGKDERYVTEQVYVHSKLMIVDDRYALLGSANINDRSLLGSRDSELAVMVVDTDNKQRDLKQNGKQVPVRHFARGRQPWKRRVSERWLATPG